MLVFKFVREKDSLNKCLLVLHETSCCEGRAARARAAPSLISNVHPTSSMASKYGMESPVELASP